MSILSKLLQRILAFWVLIALTGCDRGSPSYQHIKDLPYSEWDSYAESLPIEERLDLSKEIRERSGHNPEMTVEASFASQPAETYRSIVKRIRNGDNSSYYLGIIYEIDRSPDFKICSQPDRKIIQDYLSKLAGYPGQERYQPDFYTC